MRESTIGGIHDALYSGGTTCRSIVSSFLARIEAYNPSLNAIISLNPNALSRADEEDLALTSGNGTGKLFCIPVLLKDNYDTKDMNTTGGCRALADLQPADDAPVVKALKNAGAIILGKTNLHEMALEGLSVSSLGGQTVNPYDHTRTPGGSSGGTGAAIAAFFAVLGTGTDTVNSLRSPASANSLFSIRPTRGLISRAGIMPISHTQDAAGPIARNIDDLAVALTVMASVGHDPEDNATASIPQTSIGKDYTTALHRGSLRGKRFGLIEGFFNHTPSNETTPVNDVLATTITALTAAGATIIPITSPVYNSTHILANYDTQSFEYRESLDRYLSNPSQHGTHPHSTTSVYASDNFLVIPNQHALINTALTSSTSNITYPPTQHLIAALTQTLHQTFTTHALDALLYPEQCNLVVPIGSPNQYGRNGILAAVTGFPVVTIPTGFSPPTGDAPVGVPVGMEIMGMKWEEGKLLGLARLVDGVRRARRAPAGMEGVEVGGVRGVPSVRPNVGDISRVYPMGVLG